MLSLMVLYPGCIPFEVMMAVELVGRRFPVETATPDGLPFRSDRGLRFEASCSYATSPPAHCVLVPGGDPYDVLHDQDLARLLRRNHEQGAWIGAICAGPLLLAAAGLLDGQEFTHGYGDAHREILAPYWARGREVDAPLVTRGRIVTARPEAHLDFGVELAHRTGAITAEEAPRLRAFYRNTSGG